MFLEILLAVTAADSLTSVMDANETSKGIKAGIGVEGNEIITTLARTQKPSNLFLHAYNFAFVGIVLGLAALGQHLAQAPGTVAVVSVMPPVVLAVDAAKHYQGYRQWKWMFANPGKRVEDQEQTSWQKFIGFWG